jgi:predicted RNA-binding protein YlxR (DUF448 family)
VAPKSELLRIAICDRGDGSARAVWDGRGAMPGRGAYLCREPGSGAVEKACLQRALSRRAIPRALRAAVTIDHELLESVGR